MQHILITGAEGFIGSHLAELLLKSNYKVRALAQYNSFNYYGWLEKVEGGQNLEIVTGDVRDPYFCEKITYGIDIVFHLAALIAIPYSYSAPESYIETNVKGTLNICEGARKSGVNKVIITSTSEVYGTARYIPINENHPKQPQSPYSASKIGADAIAMSFYHSYNLPVLIARPFNTFGPRQSARAVIPAIIIQIAAGKKKISIGDTTPTRDFTFVLDTCRGLLALGNCPAAGCEVNICSGTEISIGEVFKEIAELMGSKAQMETSTERIRPEKSEVFRLVGDNCKIIEMTGWKPEISFRSGLEYTIKWLLDPHNADRYKSGIYNI